MKKFFKEVDTNNRQEMIDFLTNHFRYSTMNSWNACTSYANNIKIHSLDLSKEQRDALYELRETNEIDHQMEQCIDDFTDSQNSLWTVGTNGRSGGYLVLYKSGLKTLDYKSRCKACGQLNYTSIEENSNVCGKCGQPKRVNLINPIKTLVVYSGKDVDMYEDFEDWSDEQIKERVELVQDFDRLTDDIIEYCLSLSEEYEVVEEVVMTPKTIKVLKERG